MPIEVQWWKEGGDDDDQHQFKCDAGADASALAEVVVGALPRVGLLKRSARSRPHVLRCTAAMDDVRTDPWVGDVCNK